MILLLVGTVTWCLNARNIADQAYRYLGSPIPNDATLGDYEGTKTGTITTVEKEGYTERFTLFMGKNGKTVGTVYYFVHAVDRKIVEQAQRELQSMISELGLQRSPFYRSSYTDSTNPKDIFAHLFQFSTIHKAEKSGVYFIFVSISTVAETAR